LLLPVRLRAASYAQERDEAASLAAAQLDDGKHTVQKAVARLGKKSLLRHTSTKKLLGDGIPGDEKPPITAAETARRRARAQERPSGQV
jgi:hypothetical protein